MPNTRGMKGQMFICNASHLGILLPKTYGELSSGKRFYEML